MKSVWEADDARPRKKTPENGRDTTRVARIARIRTHESNLMDPDGLQEQGSDPQEMMRPFLEQMSDTKENGTPALLLETELPRSRFLLSPFKRVDSFKNCFKSRYRAFCSLNL